MVMATAAAMGVVMAAVMGAAITTGEDEEEAGPFLALPLFNLSI
jgi:hypothetical protein